MIKRTIYAFAFDLVFSLLPPSSLSLSPPLFWESDPPLRQIHSDLPMFKTKSKWRGAPPPPSSLERPGRGRRGTSRERGTTETTMMDDTLVKPSSANFQTPQGPIPPSRYGVHPKNSKISPFDSTSGVSEHATGWSRASPRVGPRPPCAVYHAFVPLLRALSLTRAIFANPRRSLSLLSPQFQARKHCERHGSARGSLHGRRGD